MGYMTKTGMGDNGRDNRKPCTGYMVGRNKSGELKIKFSYGEVQDTAFSLSQASGIPIEYVKPKLIIRTNRFDLNFTIGCKIELADGNRWNVTNIGYERSGITGKIKRVLLTLQGGGNV